MPLHACMLGFVFFHVFMLTYTCLDVHSHANMHISTNTCLDICSLHALYYLPCACALHAMFVCVNLGYVCHAMCYCRPCALHAMFVCVDLDYVCHAMCYCSPFVPFITFSCVLAYWFGPDLDPIVFVTVCTPWPILKGLHHPICMSMLACFYALCLC